MAIWTLPSFGSDKSQAIKGLIILLSSDKKMGEVLHLEGPKQDYMEIVFIFPWGIIFRLVSSVLYISKCELTTYITRNIILHRKHKQSLSQRLDKQKVKKAKNFSF